MTGVEINVREITFEMILPIWRDKAWPGRKSVIEPVSCIDVEGGIDIKIKQYEPKFFAAYIENQIAGVISIHKVSDTVARARGLYVEPQYTEQEIGKILLNQVKIEARKLGVKITFYLVDEKQEKYFRLNGFKTYKKQSGYEFGPHLIMLIR